MELVDEPDMVFSKQMDLELAIQHLVASGHASEESLEITHDLMGALLQGRKSPYLVYKGVKLFIEGTRERILEEESRRVF